MPLNQALAESCPDGIDLNFENVGGELLEAVLNHMNDFGRMTICGMISHYNDKTPRPGPRNLPLITSKRLRLQGFIVSGLSGTYAVLYRRDERLAQRR